MKLPDDLGIRYGGSCYRFIISRMHVFFNPVFHKCISKNTLLFTPAALTVTESDILEVCLRQNVGFPAAILYWPQQNSKCLAGE